MKFTEGQKVVLYGAVKTVSEDGEFAEVVFVGDGRIEMNHATLNTGHLRDLAQDTAIRNTIASRANKRQEGGNHYQAAIQPWDAVLAWGLGFLDGTAVKYLARWRKKNGIEDLKKAIHYIEKQIEQVDAGA